MTPADAMREQCGGSGPQYHNSRRQLTWAEVMPQPLDWDQWCVRRSDEECRRADTGRLASEP